LQQIYTLGHRNPQGMAVEPRTGEMWIHDHGPRGGDEVDVLRRGANYGWPFVTYGIDYSGAAISDHTREAGIEPPRFYWVPSIAPSGMAFYDGDRFPEWRGDLFVGALAARALYRLDLEDGRIVGQEILLADRKQRIREVKVGPDGLIYLLTDADEGQLWRIEPAVSP
jgi:aldose sugar dehydrogenase